MESYPTYTRQPEMASFEYGNIHPQIYTKTRDEFAPSGGGFHPPTVYHQPLHDHDRWSHYPGQYETYPNPDHQQWHPNFRLNPTKEYMATYSDYTSNRGGSEPGTLPPYIDNHPHPYLNNLNTDRIDGVVMTGRKMAAGIYQNPLNNMSTTPTSMSTTTNPITTTSTMSTSSLPPVVVRELRNKFKSLGDESVEGRNGPPPKLKIPQVDRIEDNRAPQVPSLDPKLDGTRHLTPVTLDSHSTPTITRFGIHGRIPILIILIVVLLIVFLSLSGLLIYYKYPLYVSYPPIGMKGINSDGGVENPCEKTYCAFGASCIVSGNGRGSCQCPDSCSSDYSPVCGTDGMTYLNECLLRKFVCQHQKTIRIKHSGKCDMPDPCADKACLFGSRCIPSPDGQFSTCECPNSCPNYGDTEESLSVCGSDGKAYCQVCVIPQLEKIGKIYKNRCELDRYACQNGKNLSVKYTGKCDPCEDILCGSPQVCHLDGERRPVCRCGEICPMDFSPICGSDGKTYSSECVMKQEACRTRRELRIIYRGKCSSGVNPCESLVCHGYRACGIDRFGIAHCACPMVCDPILQPVCGNDGKTYDSECDLMATACYEGKDVKIFHRGTCESGNLCAKYECNPGSSCEVKGGEPICSCGDCPSDYDPVCGSDGTTHQNLCRLQQVACLTNSTIRLLYTGLCNLIRDFNPDYDGCEQRQCDFYSICEPDENLPEGSRCVCPKNCSNELLDSGVVCGTDGISYNSECDLHTTACFHQKFIVIASKGHCDLCHGVHCKFGARCESGVCVCPSSCPPTKELVCASNLITYQNECELQRESCRLGRQLNIHFYGDCADGLSPSGGGRKSILGGSTSTSKNVGRNVGSTGGWVTGESEMTSMKVENGLIDPSPNHLCDSIRCEFEAVCEVGEDGFPRCTCTFNCSQHYPYHHQTNICASDLKLYSSECEMRKEACHRQTELRPRPLELCDEVEAKPCYGEEPFLLSGEEVTCGITNSNGGGGGSRQTCPSGSFCHRTSSFAKCCRKLESKMMLPPTTHRPKFPSKCFQTKYGCCPDELTSSPGPNGTGCPAYCGCNKLGSVLETCDPQTGDCHCRSGVGGLKCDRCLPGYWGLQRILIEGTPGCKSCECSRFGSAREDCEQMTGRCVCKAGVLGRKCDSCPDGEFLGPYGCTLDPINLGRSCEDGEVICSFGAECEEDGNRAGCVCNIQCDGLTSDERRGEVCGSDGFTYESECIIRLQSCRAQKSIWMVHKGPCPNSAEPNPHLSGTESPLDKRWTRFVDYTEPGDGFEEFLGSSGGSNPKISTRRHITVHQQQQAQLSTTTSFQSYLGDYCTVSLDCITPHSLCWNSWCICEDGFHQNPELTQCKAIQDYVGTGSISCNAELCQGKASCLASRNGSTTCLCPLGYTDPDKGCPKSERPFPFFNGKGSITLGRMGGHHKLSIEVDITPLYDHAHGVILFSSQHANGTGDFLSIALIDGYVEFRYDLGDGAAILKSQTRLTSGGIFHVSAKRYNRDGLLRVGEDEDVKGSSPGLMKSLNLDFGGFLGYVPINSSRIWEIVGTSAGFVGCIQKLRVGRRLINFGVGKDHLLGPFTEIQQCFLPYSSNSQYQSTTPMSLIDEDEEGGGERDESVVSIARISGEEDFWVSSLKESPCSSNPCENQGKCWIDRINSFRCVCHPLYSGKRCDMKLSNIREAGIPLDFSGFSALQLPKIQHGGRHVTIEIWFLPRSSSGLLLYDGQEWGKGDFLALYMRSGFLHFVFDLGSGVANITWTESISLHRWHWLVAWRDGREGRLLVDGGLPVVGKSPPTLSELNLDLPLLIGGIPVGSLVQRDIGRIVENFDGVMQYIRVNDETYRDEILDGLDTKRLDAYEGAPCGSVKGSSSPCQNGGTCFPRLSSYACLCLSNYTGENCSNILD